MSSVTCGSCASTLDLSDAVRGEGLRTGAKGFFDLCKILMVRDNNVGEEYDICPQCRNGCPTTVGSKNGVTGKSERNELQWQGEIGTALRPSA